MLTLYKIVYRLNKGFLLIFYLNGDKQFKGSCYLSSAFCLFFQKELTEFEGLGFERSF